MTSESGPSTASELLFEEYLGKHGNENWRFEPAIQGKRKRPDFLLPWNGDDIFLEVKQREEPRSARRLGNYDPYKGIREEIEEARRKFKEFKGYCCSLIIASIGDWRPPFTPERVFAAMLGDLGFTVPVGEDTVLDLESVQNIFLPKRGKMMRYKTGDYQNTTISSIIVVETVDRPTPEFARARDSSFAKRKTELRRELTRDERAVISIGIIQRQEFPIYDHHVRVVVCDHPSARKPLPQEMFKGPFDERWAIQKETLTRIFAGDRIDEFEKPTDEQFLECDSKDDGTYV